MSKPDTIAQYILDTCRNEQGLIALVTVEGAQVFDRRTRSEAVEIDVRIDRVICGEIAKPGEAVKLTRYTSRGDPVLKPGKRYIVAATPTPLFAPALLLKGHVKVTDATADATVRAHRERLDEADSDPA